MVKAKRLIELKKKFTGKFPDTVWIIQPENRRYLSGFRAADSQINESSGSLVINKRNAFLITDSRYSIEAQKDAKDFKVITLKKDLIEELAQILKRMKTRSLGFEEEYLTFGMHKRLTNRLRKLTPPVHLVPLNKTIEKMREIKDPHELRKMETASKKMSAILYKVVNGLRPGRTEIEIARKIEQLAYEEGADDLAFPSIVASGPNGALPHAVPTNRKIREKEPVVIDVGLKYKGYCCDMTRTLFLGIPGPKFRKIYRIVREAQLTALKEIRPGMKSSEADSIARDIIKNAGFGDFFGHSLGHGVGLATHEGPALSPKKPVILEKGMVVTVEPGIYLPGSGGVRLEEMVVIEKKGAKILTKNDIYYDF